MVMNKRKVVIHGADVFGEKLAKRIEYIFDVIGFIDRRASGTNTKKSNIPVYRDYQDIEENVDFIILAIPDFNGQQREYVKRGVPFEKILDFRHPYDYEKHILHQCLVNELMRRGVPGSVAELGVDYGDTAKYINLYFPDRTCYLFDTFSGFDQRDKDESQALTPELLEFYNARSNAERVLERMFYPEQCVVKAGYFPESLEGLEDNFAFVHIDCDLYNPILAGLEYFYPRLNKGGYIAVHDFYNILYPQAKEAVRDFADKYKLTYMTDFFSDSAIFSKE